MVFVGAEEAATIEIGGVDQTVEVMAWDPTNRVVEIAIPVAGITGIIDDTMSIVQGTVTGDISDDGVKRELHVVLTQGSSAFAAADATTDENSAAAVLVPFATSILSVSICLVRSG